MRIPKIRRVGGKRTACIRKVETKYRVRVIIREKEVKVFADTGAEITVMSKHTADSLGLRLEKTHMRIRPYGSRSKKCIGKYTGTIMFNRNVANAIIYVVESKGETLLSGPLAEELGIITFNGKNINQISNTEESFTQPKRDLVTEFPELFQGIGKLKDHKVRLHIDKSIVPSAEPARPVPYHLEEKLKLELKKMEDQGIIEEHIGPAPWISNLVLAPKEQGIRVTLDI